MLKSLKIALISLAAVCGVVLTNVMVRNYSHANDCLHEAEQVLRGKTSCLEIGKELDDEDINKENQEGIEKALKYIKSQRERTFWSKAFHETQRYVD